MRLPSSPPPAPCGTRRARRRSRGLVRGGARRRGPRRRLAARRARTGAGATRRIEGPTWQLLEFRQDGRARARAARPRRRALPLGRRGARHGRVQHVRLDVHRRPRIASRSPRPSVQTGDVRPRGGRASTRSSSPRSPRRASWEVDGSQMTLADAAGEELLAFTNARVPEDPTIAPWRLSRVVGRGRQRSVARSRAAMRSSDSCRAGGSRALGLRPPARLLHDERRDDRHHGAAVAPRRLHAARSARRRSSSSPRCPR